MWRSARMAGALGIEIVLCLVIGGGAGYFLDYKLKTHWIMYLGIFFGMGAAIKAITRVTKAYKRETEDSPSGNQGGGGAGAN